MSLESRSLEAGIRLFSLENGNRRGSLHIQKKSVSQCDDMQVQDLRLWSPSNTGDFVEAYGDIAGMCTWDLEHAPSMLKACSVHYL